MSYGLTDMLWAHPVSSMLRSLPACLRLPAGRATHYGRVVVMCRSTGDLAKKHLELAFFTVISEHFLVFGSGFHDDFKDVFRTGKASLMQLGTAGFGLPKPLPKRRLRVALGMNQPDTEGRSCSSIRQGHIINSDSPWTGIPSIWPVRIEPFCRDNSSWGPGCCSTALLLG